MPGWWGFAAALLVWGVAAAADRPVIAPAPDWVKPLPIPAAKTGVGGASQLLLDDVQIHFAAGRTDQIVDSTGLAAAGNLSFLWSPDTQTLTLHKARILRGDKVIDLIDRPEKITVLRREPNLELAMLNGALTAVIEPEGVQAGDILDLAFTYTDQDPLTDGHSESVVEAPRGAPARRFHLVATWDRGKPLRWRLAAGLGEPVAQRTPAGEALTIDRSDFETPDPPEGAPDRFQHPERTSFSDFGSWSAVSSLLSPLYQAAGRLAPGSPLQAEVARIAAQTRDPKARAALALQLVEQQVRYMALLMNQGGLRPADADLTWTRRFGDCKAKSALLVGLLHALGIEAEPALVSSSSGDGLPDDLPALIWFDHVIVRAKIDGKTYWLDGTRPTDRGLDEIEPPSFQWALPITPDGSQLVAIELPPAARPIAEVDRTFDLSAGADAPAKARVEIVYGGDLALGVHLGLATLTHADLEKQLRTLFEKSISWITPSSVDAHWDETSGRMRLTLDGAGPLPWTDHAGGRHFDIPDSELGTEVSLRRQTGIGSDAPFAVPYPLFVVNRTRIVLPDRGKGYTLEGGGDVDRVIAGIAYRRTSQIADGAATLETSVRSLQREFPAAGATAAQAALDTLAEKPVWLEAPAPPEAAPAKAPAHATPPPAAPELGSVEDLANSGVRRLLAHDFPGAIGDLSRAIALDPAGARLVYNRGVAYAALGDFPHALADFDAAVRLEPHSVKALAARARIRFETGDDKGARADLDAAVAAAPQTPEAARVAARTYREAGRFADAVATYDRLLVRFPTDAQRPEMLNERCWTRAAWGHDLPAALADCEAALSARPGDAAFLDSRALVELRLGRLAQALRDYDAALATRPSNAESLYGRGLAKLRSGDETAATIDLQAAAKLDPRVAGRFADWGLRP
jgi:tetratricopeptide (TPR) repeat protein/transglutaminase-like putative cysteine protease